MQKPEENYLYDPLEAPDPDAWLALDESERRYKTLEYHLLFEKGLPAPEAHATIHTIVETQLAMEVKPLPATLMRLMEEGLNRHEAIHAIASVLIGEISELLNPNKSYYKNFHEMYAKRLKKLTAKGWLKGKW